MLIAGIIFCVVGLLELILTVWMHLARFSMSAMAYHFLMGLGAKPSHDPGGHPFTELATANSKWKRTTIISIITILAGVTLIIIDLVR